MIKLKALLPEVWDANLLEQSESFIVFCDFKIDDVGLMATDN